MKKKTENMDKRLLGALDHIDDRFVEEAANKIKERPAGAYAGGINKRKAFRQMAVLAACMFLLGAALPLAANLIGRLPGMLAGAGSSEAEPTQPPKPDDPALSEEYFTAGAISHISGAWNGIDYEGNWIYVDRSHNRSRILKYDPETKEISSACIDFACTYSYNDCELCVPALWDINYIEIIGDWLLYGYTTDASIATDKGGSTLSVYNMKTGESRVVSEKTVEGNTVTYPVECYAIDGKAYFSVSKVENPGTTDKVRTEYIYSYDPETDETVYMFEKPENMALIGITNKRFIFTVPRQSLSAPANIWTTDYTGGNLKKEDVLDFDTVMVCGTYAYEANPEMIDYAKAGYNLRVYDVKTNTVFKIDLGFEVDHCLVDSGRLFFTTITNDRTVQLYETDLRGENKKLVFESRDMSFYPVRGVGDHLVIKVQGSASGYLTIDLSLGVITDIPVLKAWPDSAPW